MATKKTKKEAFQYVTSKIGKTFYQRGNFWLPNGICSYPRLVEPESYKNNPDLTKYYSMDLVYESLDEIKSSGTWKEFGGRVKDMLKEVFGDEDHSKINLPWRDFEETDEDGNSRKRVRIKTKVSEKRHLQFYGPGMDPIDPNLITFGDTVTAQVQLYGTWAPDGMYIGCTLNAVWKRKDGNIVSAARKLTEDDFASADDIEMDTDTSTDEGDEEPFEAPKKTRKSKEEKLSTDDVFAGL